MGARAGRGRRGARWPSTTTRPSGRRPGPAAPNAPCPDKGTAHGNLTPAIDTGSVTGPARRSRVVALGVSAGTLAGLVTGMVLTEHPAPPAAGATVTTIPDPF